MSLPVVAVGALGGTIAMTSDSASAAVTPGLNAEDLVAAVPSLSEVAEIRAETIRNVASPALVVADDLAALDFARRAVDDGAVGVVITHGTDTLEETVYFLDLLWDRPEPIVVTGAMRSPNLPGADGPANLLTAVVTAADPDARGIGVLAALDDAVHLARLVAKTSTTALSTFQSPGWGPVGRVNERKLRMMLRPMRLFDPLPAPSDGPIRVPIYESSFSDDGAALAALVAGGFAGLVIAGSGAGHLSVPAADHAERAVKSGIPVVLASRAGSGTTLERTYGYPGSESDLIGRGLIPAGYLGPREARLLLHVLIEAGADDATIRAEFAARGF